MNPSPSPVDNFGVVRDVGYVRGVNANRPDGASATTASATTAPESTAPETTGSTPGPGRVVLLTTSHRVAPGLLSW